MKNNLAKSKAFSRNHIVVPLASDFNPEVIRIFKDLTSLKRRQK